MHKLRAELRQIATQAGDYGPPQLRGQMIDEFVDSLLEFFTEQGLETFSAIGLREIYYSWMVAKQEPYKPFHLMSRFAPLGGTMEGRAVAESVEAPNVVALH